MSKTMLIVFLGPPGSGKGTQGKELASDSGIAHVATGDLFRAEIAKASPLGKTVQETIASGKLVSDDLTFQVLKTQLLQIVGQKHPRVVILDGYPRNGAQVDLLGALIKEHKDQLQGPVFFELQVPRNVIVERISGRLVNPRTGAVYHKTERPPKVAGKCDVDGGELTQRPDDKAEVVGGRYDVYQAGLKEILGRIQQAGYKHHSFDGSSKIEAISANLRKKLHEVAEG